MSVKSAGSAFYQKVDQGFYDEVKRENGGKLPVNLLDSSGNPRKLTMSAGDRAYRQTWNAIAARQRNSKAVPNKSVKSPCVPCALKAAAGKLPPIVLPSKAGGKPVKVGTTAPAAAAAAAKQKKQTEVPCKNETLVIECSHLDKRQFKLELPPKDGAIGLAQFEVIDDGKESITCTTKTTGPCPAIHKGKVFDLYPDDTTQRKSDTTLVFEAKHDPNLPLYSFSELFSPGKARSPQSYSVRTQTCQQDQPLSATVLVYPQLDWEFDISLGVSSTGSVNASGTKGRIPTEDRSSEFDFSGTVAVTVAGSRKEFGAEIKQDLQRALKFADLACQTAEFLWAVADDIGGVEVSFDYPALAFNGTWGWREIEASPKCGYGCDWSLGFSPLVGASVKLDILSFLITKIPAVGQVIERVRKTVEKEAEISVYVEVSGEIDGTFNYKKIAGEQGDASGKLEGKVGITLEGLIKTKEFRWLCFHAGGEAKLGGHASFTGDVQAGSDGSGAYYQGNLDFDGLSIYAVLAGGIGFSFGDPPRDEETYEAGDAGSDDSELALQGKIDTSEIEGSVLYQHVWVLIPSRTLLGSGEKHYFLDEQEGD